MNVGAYNSQEQAEKWNQHWKKISLFQKSAEIHKDDPKFFFIDGPPYANAPPHMGHAYTRVLRESVLKYKQMRGNNVWLQLGFDTHGLPVSNMVQAELGLKSNADVEAYGVDRFNEACKKHALKYLDDWLNFYEQYGSLALWDFDKRYYTFKNEYIDSTWHFFSKAKEHLYRGKMTVPWCSSCETALSSTEASKEYHDVEDNSIFVKFPVKKEKGTYLLVWTTTPWTLPGNMAVAANEKYDYVKVKTKDAQYILAKELAESVLGKMGEEFEIVQEMTGKQLEGLEYSHLLEEEVPIHKTITHKVINADLVTLTDGTGLVHIAPGHGPEDYDAGLKYKLQILSPVDGQGKLTSEAGKYEGIFVFAANKHIIEDIEKKGLLALLEKIKHKYPYCERCHNKLLYRASHQWFFKIDAVKQKMIEENKKVNWSPDYVSKRFGDWLENSRDWCITRQKFWGIPIPIWECECGHYEIVGSLDELKKKSKNCPDDLELHKPYVDAVTITCAKCGKEMKRNPDICDVWLDSGAATWASMNYPKSKEFEKWYPMKFITEGLDQTRGWFYTLMIENTLLFDKSPYESVQVNGLVLDAKGEKMSKSKGNGVDPRDEIAEHGADALRWFLLGNVSIGENSCYDLDNLKTIKSAVGTIWNVYTFMNKFYDMDGYDKKPAKLDAVDEWILSRLEFLKQESERGYDSMDPSISAKALRDFAVNDLSRDYIKFIRNRLKNDENKQGAYYTLYLVMKDLSKIMAPITPFLAEEIYQGVVADKESVHLEAWPAKGKRNEALEKNVAFMKQVVESASNIRNKIGVNLRQPLKELVIVTESKEAVPAVKAFSQMLCEQANVLEVRVASAPSGKYESLQAENMALYLSTDITPELEKAGLTREITRRVQQMRKELGLIESDKIVVCIEPKVDINYEEFQRLTNTAQISDSAVGEEKSWKINEKEVKISAKKL